MISLSHASRYHKSYTIYVFLLQGVIVLELFNTNFVLKVNATKRVIKWIYV